MLAAALDTKLLKIAETSFMAAYPGGFEHPEMVALGKKHRFSKLAEQAQAAFAKARFKDSDAICEDMVRIIGRSSMVSMFEKPKFRGFVQRLNTDERAFLANALKSQLHGDQQAGFEAMVDLLKTEKLAKWTLISAIPAYYRPEQEVFVKPTTAKNIINNFKVADLHYHPSPSWDFYRAYRALVNAAKTQVDPRLSPNNPAFTGFLMSAMKMQGFNASPERL